MNEQYLKRFLRESNIIEGIDRVTKAEIEAAKKFLELKEIKVQDLQDYIKATQPDAVLRDRVGLNVRVGNYRPPAGGSDIREELEGMLANISNDKFGTPFESHYAYEGLHPFTDGNGRSGRLLWLWQMINFEYEPTLSFLHSWYYQSLSNRI